MSSRDNRMSEIFLNEEIEEIILDNKDLVESRQEPFSVNRERLSRVFDQVNAFNDIENLRERIITKASHLLGGITWQQPFSEGNKETALSLTKLFLRRNGFDLPFETKEEEKEIYELLVKTVFKDELDETIITEVREYLLKKVIVY